MPMIWSVLPPALRRTVRPVAAAEMVLIRLAHAATLPTLDEALKALEHIVIPEIDIGVSSWGRRGRLGVYIEDVTRQERGTHVAHKITVGRG